MYDNEYKPSRFHDFDESERFTVVMRELDGPRLVQAFGPYPPLKAYEEWRELVLVLSGMRESSTDEDDTLLVKLDEDMKGPGPGYFNHWNGVYVDDLRTIEIAECVDNRRAFLNVYAVYRPYGGPEEGGWYYDAGDPWLSFPTRDLPEKEQNALHAALREVYPRTGGRDSVLQTEDYEVVWETHPARHYPEVTPHYE